MKYFTKSGSVYEIDDENYAIRNGRLYAHKYLGMSDYYETRNRLTENTENVNNLVFMIYTNPKKIYKIYKKGEIHVNNCSFEEAKNFIDNRSNLLFINEDLEEIIMSTPIFHFEDN